VNLRFAQANATPKIAGSVCLANAENQAERKKAKKTVSLYTNGFYFKTLQ